MFCSDDNELQLVLDIPPSLNFTVATAAMCFLIDVPLLSLQFIEGNSGEILIELEASEQSAGLVQQPLQSAVVTVFQAPRVHLVSSSTVNVSEGNAAVVCYTAFLDENKLQTETFQLNLTLEVMDISTSMLLYIN